MFNSFSVTHGGTTNNLTFNSTSGTLVKSTPESKVIRFHMGSSLATAFFNADVPNRGRQPEYPRALLKVLVLQVMLCGGDNYLVEYLDLKE